MVVCSVKDSDVLDKSLSNSPRTPNVHISGPWPPKNIQNSTRRHQRETKKRKCGRERKKKSEIGPAEGGWDRGFGGGPTDGFPAKGGRAMWGVLLGRGPSSSAAVRG